MANGASVMCVWRCRCKFSADFKNRFENLDGQKTNIDVMGRCGTGERRVALECRPTDKMTGKREMAGDLVCFLRALETDQRSSLYRRRIASPFHVRPLSQILPPSYHLVGDVSWKALKLAAQFPIWSRIWRGNSRPIQSVYSQDWLLACLLILAFDSIYFSRKIKKKPCT